MCDFLIPSPMSNLALSGCHDALDSRSCQFVCLEKTQTLQEDATLKHNCQSLTYTHI